MPETERTYHIILFTHYHTYMALTICQAPCGFYPVKIPMRQVLLVPFYRSKLHSQWVVEQRLSMDLSLCSFHSDILRNISSSKLPEQIHPPYYKAQCELHLAPREASRMRAWPCRCGQCAYRRKSTERSRENSLCLPSAQLGQLVEEALVWFVLHC